LQYRKFGRLDWEASALGLGCGMLPDNAGESIGLIRCAIDHGVNFLDLGHPYVLGRHERAAVAVGAALADGYRNKVKVALTLPVHLIHSKADLEAEFSRQLSLMGAERVDFCLFGSLNRENWPVLRALGALEWMETALKEGRAGYAGFAFHDHYQPLKSIVESWDRWTLCRFQFSYVDVSHDPGITGIRYAAGKGLAVAVTEPMKGSRLEHLPGPAADMLAGVENRSPAEWALRFVWNFGEIATVVLDANSVAGLKKAVELAGRCEPDSLTVQEEVLIGKVRDALMALREIPCPSCRACMPCPEEIDVPRIFELYNDAFIYGDVESARLIYQDEGHQPGLCTECGYCEKNCAKRLPVLDLLKKAVSLLKR